MDAALLVLARKAGIDPDAVRQEHDRVDMIPFESASRFMATLDRDPGGEVWIHVKGAPERVFEMCAGVEVAAAEEAEPFDAADWKRRVDDVAADGLPHACRRPASRR
jgi:magnesium-transporting ATPase (P-type)